MMQAVPDEATREYPIVIFSILYYPVLAILFVLFYCRSRIISGQALIS